MALDDLRWTAQIAGRIGVSATLEALVRTSADILDRFAQVTYRALYLFDFEEQRMRLFHARGFTDEERAVAEATALDRHPGWVMRTQQPLRVGDTAQQPHDSPSKDSPRSLPVRSRLWLPVVVDGDSVGAIGLASTAVEAFDAYDQDVLLVVAELVGLAYLRLRAEHSTRRQRERAVLAEQALELATRRQLEARHAVILASIGDAVIACDTARRITLLNPVAEALTGYTSAEAHGRPIEEVFRLVASETREPAPLRVAEVLATGKALGFASNAALLRRDGVATPIADSAAPIVEDGVTLGVVLTFRDVTEDRARAAALRAQQEQLTALLASTAALVYSARLPDFTIDFISPSAHELLGFTPDEMMAPGFWDWAIHPDDRDRVLAALPALFVDGRHVHEYRHRHKRGGYRWLRDEPRLVFDDAGRPLRAVGASFDITARKRDEQRLGALYAVQQVVSRVSRAFLATPHADPAAVLRAPLAELGAACHADRVYVCLSAGVTFEHAYEWCAAGVEARDLATRRALFERSPRGLPALRAGLAVQCPTEGATDEERASYEALCAALGVVRAAVVPMMVDGALRGVVGVDNASLEALEADELTRLLQLFADAVAAGLRRAENERALQGLNHQLAQRAERQRALFELSTGLALTSDRAMMWQRIRATLRCFFKVERFSYGEVDGVTGAYTLRMVDEPPTLGEAAPHADAAFPLGATQPGAALDITGTAIAEALARGVPVTTRDRAVEGFRDWSTLRERRGYNQFVVIPLLDSGGSFATLNVSAIQDAPPDLDDIRWIEQVGIAAAAHLAALAARESLRALNRDLEDRVALRTRELQQSEERFERLFQYAPQAMLIVDADGRVSQSNRNAQKLFGYSDEAFVGLPVSELVPHAVRERHAGLQRAYTEAGAIVVMASDRQVSALRSDGRPFMAEVGLVPLRLNGEQAVLVGVSDVSDRVAAQAEVTRSLREKETLLKEIHHRVKNNLQIFSSLLMLQADQSPSAAARAPLEESVHRVRSMALIHEQLYGSDTLERIELGTYARQLVGALRGTLAPRARVKVRATPVEVSVDTAVPVGLILNELLTNAFKYGLARPAVDLAARPGRTGPDCDVLLEVGAEGDTLRLAVSDSGPGLAPQFATAVASTLGLQLVRSLTRQLRGTLSVASDEGTQFTLVCPLRRHA